MIHYDLAGTRLPPKVTRFGNGLRQLTVYSKDLFMLANIVDMIC